MSIIFDVHWTIIYALMHTRARIQGSTAFQVQYYNSILFTRTRDPQCPAGSLSSLMSLDFFFVPLATKVGASLDQVKASREEKRGRRVLGADVSFSLAHHLSTCVISPRQPIHTDTPHTANFQTSFQYLHCIILFCTST